VSYIQDYRAIQETVDNKGATNEESFQLNAPYLKQFESVNKDSVVVCKNDNENCLKFCFICPGIMKKTMRFVRPVLAFDGCHLKSQWKGAMYVTTATSPLVESFSSPIK
jgi:hypothetical protein